MKTAAGQGAVNVIQWLHRNRTEGCSEKAMLGAARGHVRVMATYTPPGGLHDLQLTSLSWQAKLRRCCFSTMFERRNYHKMLQTVVKSLGARVLQSGHSVSLPLICRNRVKDCVLHNRKEWQGQGTLTGHFDFGILGGTCVARRIERLTRSSRLKPCRTPTATASRCTRRIPPLDLERLRWRPWQLPHKCTAYKR